jgi:DNA polymerase III subunit gamma/tau
VTKSARSVTTRVADKQPLAIRYRPSHFGEVVGQASAVEILRGMVKSRRVPGMILLYGPYGSGKTTLARLIALYLNCAKLVKGEPCGRCESCRMMKGVILGHGEHSDVHEIDAADQRGIDDVRALKRLAELQPMTGSRRIFILDECHAYTPDAWRSALKLFERPPGKTTFILSTTEMMKVPDTIISRSICLRLNPVKSVDTAALLRRVCRAEGYGKKVGKRLCLRIAVAADSHPRNALNSLETVLNYVDSTGSSRVDVAKVLPKLIADTPSMKGYLAAQDFVTAVLSGQYRPAFAAVLSADNQTSFINQAVSLLRLQIEAWIDRGLVDRQRYWMLNKISGPKQDQGRAHLVEYGEMLSILLNAQQVIKGYQVDPIAALETAALQCIAISHEIALSEKKHSASAKSVKG